MRYIGLKILGHFNLQSTPGGGGPFAGQDD